jgi:hypothetical protein
MNNKDKHTNPISNLLKAGGKLGHLLSTRIYFVILEIGLVVIAFILFYLFLSKHMPSGIFSTDVLSYMNLSLNNLKNTHVLNRYMHIFIQKIFLETAKTPLAGEQNFWSFIVSSTAVLTYWNARQLFNRPSIIRGIVAVLAYLSINIYLQLIGNVMPDLSVMFMVNVFLLIYLASINRENRSKVLILFLGAVFYLAFKTKETALFPLFVLLPGIGFIGNRFSSLLFKKNFLLLLLGFLAGVFCFAILSGLILKDPFWGLRIGEIKEFFTTYIVRTEGEAYSQQDAFQDWYSAFLLGSLTFPFVFYLLSGISKAHELTISKRLVWLLPLGAIAFIIPTTNITWGGRFFLPIIPVISILGSGLIEEDVLVANKGLIFKTCALVFLALVLYGGIRIAMRYLLPPLGIRIDYVIFVIMNPIIFTALLAAIFLVPRPSYFRNLVLLFTLLIMTLPIISYNFKTARNVPSTFSSYQEITYPFRVFAGEIKFFPGMHLATSTNVWDTPITKNIDELMCLFNVYFDASATRASFIFSDDLDQLLSKAMDQDFPYILITTDEWNQTLSKPSLAAEIQESYRIFTEDREGYVLLSRK